MDTKNTLPWDGVYESFTGEMKGCLGSSCPTPCCGDKYVATAEGVPKRYNTILFDDGELTHQESLGSLAERGVTTEKVEISGAVKETRILVRGCFNAEKGGCQLEDRKPLACRLFPLRPSTANPLDLRCVQAPKIAQETDTLHQIGEARKQMGHRDTEKWLNAVKRAASA